MKHLRILAHQYLTSLASYRLLNAVVFCVVAFCFLEYCIVAFGGVAFGTEPPSPIDFKKQVLPLLTKRCSKCHSEDVRIVGLTLTTAEGIKKGSQNGPVVIPQKAIDSPLYKRLKQEQMPPGGEGKVFDAQELELIRKWIEEGAKTE